MIPDNKRYLLGFILFFSLKVFAFTGTVKFSNDFYAAQKYFYNQAKLKFSKIGSDRFYPEVPIKGAATNDELKQIEPLTDYFEARSKFLYELSQYPEQIYPEIFSFLNGHPGLSVKPGNSSKSAALEKYFAPFYFLFSSDKHYNFGPEILQNPCPLIFILKDEKKNNFSFSLNSSFKKNFEFTVSESPKAGYLSSTLKKPMVLKPGANATIKIMVDVKKLKSDSGFKIINLVLTDPSQPKIKIIVPVVLLPVKELLQLPPHVFDFTFSYGTFFKHISLQKEKASWPEPCPSSDCSGKKKYTTRSPERLSNSYDYGDLCKVQYYLTTASAPVYNLKSNAFRFYYNETGNLAGEERNCTGAQAGVEIHCPPGTPNNGKEIYGNRKIDFKVLLPAGKVHEIHLKLQYNDLSNQPSLYSELSWLQEKTLLVVITDQNDKEVFKEFVTKTSVEFTTKTLQAGIYTVSVFPTTQDGKHVPSFNIQHLNHAYKSRFDFALNGSVLIISSPKTGK